MRLSCRSGRGAVHARAAAAGGMSANKHACSLPPHSHPVPTILVAMACQWRKLLVLHRIKSAMLVRPDLHDSQHVRPGGGREEGRGGGGGE
eukprot:466202-Hanusia_phi.AAC.1